MHSGFLICMYNAHQGAVILGWDYCYARRNEPAHTG